MAVNFYSQVHFADNVGIGTTNPITELQLGDGTSSQQLLLLGPNSNSNSSEIIFGDATTVSGPNYAGVGLRYNSSSNVFTFRSFYSGAVQDVAMMTLVRDSGNVGIGTSSPTYKLQVAGKSYLSGGIQMNSGDEIDFGNSNQYITGVNDTSLTLATGGSATLTATHAGNVGIGTTSPDAKLHVNGTFIVAEDSEKGLDINTQTYNYKIGDIDAGESQTYIEVDSVNAKTTLHNSTLELGHASDTTIARASAGKVTIEGNEIQTTNVHHHFLNSGFYLSYPYSRYIPLNGSISEQNVPGSTPEYTGFIWPYDGYVKTIWVRSEANSGNTLMQLYKGTNGNTNGGTAMGSVTEACGAHTSVEFDFTGVTNSFSQGEGMAIKIDPTNTSQGVIVTIECVFNLTT